MPATKTINELCPLCKGGGTMKVVTSMALDGGTTKIDAVGRCEACRGRGMVLVEYWSPSKKMFWTFAAAIFAILAWSFAIIAWMNYLLKKGG